MWGWEGAGLPALPCPSWSCTLLLSCPLCSPGTPRPLWTGHRRVQEPLESPPVPPFPAPRTGTPLGPPRCHCMSRHL